MENNFLYEKHELVGHYVRTTEAIIFADGSGVPKGTTGKIISVEPATSSLVYIVDTHGFGVKGFSRNQFGLFV